MKFLLLLIGIICYTTAFGQHTIIVSPDGTANYTNVQDAFNSIKQKKINLLPFS